MAMETLNNMRTGIHKYRTVAFIFASFLFVFFCGCKKSDTGSGDETYIKNYGFSNIGNIYEDASGNLVVYELNVQGNNYSNTNFVKLDPFGNILSETIQGAGSD